MARDSDRGTVCYGIAAPVRVAVSHIRLDFEVDAVLPVVSAGISLGA